MFTTSEVMLVSRIDSGEATELAYVYIPKLEFGLQSHEAFSLIA